MKQFLFKLWGLFFFFWLSSKVLMLNMKTGDSLAFTVLLWKVSTFASPGLESGSLLLSAWHKSKSSFKKRGFCMWVYKINQVFLIYEIHSVGCDPLLHFISCGKMNSALEPQICLTVGCVLLLLSAYIQTQLLSTVRHTWSLSPKIRSLS